MTARPSTLRIGTTIADSTPEFSPRPTPPAGAPNVVVIVLDDLGFGQLGCFGSDLDTPVIDQLAANGLRYSRFHVTALCSPTRAALLTGRNHHAVGMGFLTDVPIGFPGYDARIPPTAATLPRVLRDNGYATFAVGKWHLAPRWEQSAAGPFDQWPLGLGFQRYYGFLGGDANQWAPELVSDNGFVDPPAAPEDGYHLTEDLVDRARRYILDQQHARPGAPFFMYFAPGAVHAPHQAPAAWIDRYRGRFDGGWDEWRNALFDRQIAAGIVPDGTQLTARPPWVSDWNALTDEQRRLYARQMECFAGFLSHTDDQIGRLLGTLDDLGVRDDTIVMVISDNGTSAEGGPIGSHNEHRFTHDRLDDFDDSLARIDELGGHRAYNHYSWGWAWAGNTPMRLWKRYTWLGGVRTPLIVSWPSRIRGDAAGAVRTQFCHAVDVAPTILDALGIDAPTVVDGHTQQRVDGASLLSTFDDPDAPDPRSTQYFEMLGSRAIYHDGWKATTDHVGNQLSVEREMVAGSHDFDDDHWALFDLRNDFSESTDLAALHPDVVEDLQRRWRAEAEANQVFPLDDSLIGRATALEPNPNPPRWRSTYLPGGGPVAEDALPGMGGGFRLVTDVELAAAANGAVVCLGDWNNGWALTVHDGVVAATFNLFGDAFRALAASPLDAGRHEIAIEYRRQPEGGGPVTLSVDDAEVASVDLPIDLPFRWQIGGTGMRIGSDVGFPVSDDYWPPFDLDGTLGSVTIEIPAFAPGGDGESSGLDARVADAIAEALHRE